MFTGIVEASVALHEVTRRGTGAALTLPLPEPGWQAALGDSIAVSGCCLTVARLDAQAVGFDLSAETLSLTWLARAKPGRRVNLERALRVGDRLGGHLVYGHVDGVGRIVSAREGADGGRVLEIEAPATLERYLVSKGSVTVDGVSLTVVEPRAPRFAVALIPETLARTTLGVAAVGDEVHLEADAIGKWLERLLQRAAR